MNPTSADELADAVRSAPRVIAVGAGTKPRLSSVGPDVVRISTAKLRGIIEYEPSEFTFTALAGTPVREIAAALGERGQYLPFDPLLAEAGATLGGTVAAGLNGPGRFRFGGLRDFILGVRFADGAGRLLRLGGKVVKNAAGFDLPKFLVGSAGRFGAIAEVTLKVFPRPSTTHTLSLDAANAAAQVDILTESARARWEIDALDVPPAGGRVLVRLAGPATALDAIAAEILKRWPGVTLPEAEAREAWSDLSEFRWAHLGGTLVKVVLTPSAVPEFTTWTRTQADARHWISAGGNVAYLSLPPDGRTDSPTHRPTGLPWPALTLRGDAPLWPGAKPRFEVMQSVKAALDPESRFPDIDE